MSQKKPRHQDGKRPNFAKNKKAFDAVMKAYRNAGLPSLDESFVPVAGNTYDTGLLYDRQVRDENETRGAMLGSGKPTKNPATPSPTDFRIDVELIVERTAPDMESFTKAYFEVFSDDVIEQEMHADKVMGKVRHALEQRLGVEFLRKGLYPVNKYFTSERRPKHGV